MDASIYIKEVITPQDHFKVGKIILSLFSSFILVIIGWRSDFISRCQAIFLAACVFFFGRLLLSMANNYFLLLAGRLIATVGVGFALMISPVYIAEISPPSCRATLSMLPEVFFNFGLFLAHSLNFILPKIQLNLGLLVILGLAVILSHLLAVGILAMPESPQWLVLRGRLSSANRAIVMISNSDDEAARQVSDTLRSVGITDCDDDLINLARQSTLAYMYPTWSVFHLVTCTVAMHLFKEASGIEAILQSPQILGNIGMSDSYRKLLATIVVDFIKLLGMLYPIFHLDHVGRRKLMLLSIAGMFLSLLSLASCFNTIEQSKIDLSWVVVVSLVLYVFSFSIGLAPITAIYASEAFPLRLRAKGTAFGFAVSLAVSESSSSIFSWMCRSLSFGGAALVFATVASIFWILFYIIMPETKGLKLEDIGLLFGSFINWRTKVRGLEIQMQRINSDSGTTVT